MIRSLLAVTKQFMEIGLVAEIIYSCWMRKALKGRNLVKKARVLETKWSLVLFSAVCRIDFQMTRRLPLIILKAFLCMVLSLMLRRLV